VIYYRGLKFPQKAMVVVLLESDAACTCLNGHSAGKSAVLVCDDCLCKTFWLGEQRSSDITVSCNLAKPSDIQSENTRFETL